MEIHGHCVVACSTRSDALDTLGARMHFDETLAALQSMLGTHVGVSAQTRSGRPFLTLMGTLEAGTAAHTVLVGGDPDTLIFTFREIPLPLGFFFLKKSEFEGGRWDDSLTRRVLIIELKGGALLAIGTEIPTGAGDVPTGDNPPGASE